MNVETNVATLLVRSAEHAPDRAAVIEPEGRRGWRVTSFRRLAARAEAFARGLDGLGLARGDRVALFVRPGADWIALVFALFRSGAVPVLCDPGIGRTALVRALARTRPRVLIGVPLAHALRAFHRRELDSIEIAVQTGRALVPGVPALDEIARPDSATLTPRPVAPHDTAAILFTSGSTGPAKGVVTTHGTIAAQVAALRALYGFRPGEVDLACFPPFALFDVGLETTCVVPRIDPARPARCDPARIVEALEAHACTTAFGSPAVWRRVSPWARERGLHFAALGRVLIAGAPVSPALIDATRALLGVDGDVHTPYGATECLPVTSIAGREIAELRGRIEGGFGACVGRAVPGIDLAVIPVGDTVIPAWDDALVLPAHAIGELCARGPTVTSGYANDPDATRRARIAGTDGRAWHRLGDAGYLDEQGRAWIVGRVSERIDTAEGPRWPVPVENACNLHPLVRRTALVGVGARPAQRATLVVEPLPSAMPRDAEAEARLAREIELVRAAAWVPGSPAGWLDLDRVVFERSLPVDARHNAKIRRDLLARELEARA